MMQLKFPSLFLLVILASGCSEKAPEVPVPEPTAMQLIAVLG